MSTRSSVIYEPGGVHIFHDLADDSAPLFLEYSCGAFVVCVPLSVELADVIYAGCAAIAKRKKGDAR